MYIFQIGRHCVYGLSLQTRDGEPTWQKDNCHHLFSKYSSIYIMKEILRLNMAKKTVQEKLWQLSFWHRVHRLCSRPFQTGNINNLNRPVVSFARRYHHPYGMCVIQYNGCMILLLRWNLFLETRNSLTRNSILILCVVYQRNRSISNRSIVLLAADRIIIK